MLDVCPRWWLDFKLHLPHHPRRASPNSPPSIPNQKPCTAEHGAQQHNRDGEQQCPRLRRVWRLETRSGGVRFRNCALEFYARITDIPQPLLRILLKAATNQTLDALGQSRRKRIPLRLLREHIGHDR